MNQPGHRAPPSCGGRASQPRLEIDMRPTPFRMIAFALIYLLFVAGLIAIGYVLLNPGLS